MSQKPVAAKVRSTLAIVALAGATASCSTGDSGTAVREQPSLSALTTGPGALELVFEGVCVPTVLDGSDFAALALSKRMGKGKSARDGTGQSSQTFLLAGFANASATLWADGTCTVGIQYGNPGELADMALGVLSARGLNMVEGQTDVAGRGGIRTVHCTEGPRPLVLVTIQPGEKRNGRDALVANLFRARGESFGPCRS